MVAPSWTLPRVERWVGGGKNRSLERHFYVISFPFTWIWKTSHVSLPVQFCCVWLVIKRPLHMPWCFVVGTHTLHYPLCVYDMSLRLLKVYPQLNMLVVFITVYALSLCSASPEVVLMIVVAIGLVHAQSESGKSIALLQYTDTDTHSHTYSHIIAVLLYTHLYL